MTFVLKLRFKKKPINASKPLQQGTIFSKGALAYPERPKE